MSQPISFLDRRLVQTKRRAADWARKVALATGKPMDDPDIAGIVEMFEQGEKEAQADLARRNRS